MDDQSVEYLQLLEAVESLQGKIHPAVLELPEEVQLEILREASCGECIISEVGVENFCSDLDFRMLLVSKLARYLN
jgi:hypothetical protein